MDIVVFTQAHILFFACLLSVLSAFMPALAQSTEQTRRPTADDLTKQLADPIANLASIPMQSDIDFGSGPRNEGVRYTLNIEPVILIELNEDWMLISQAIVPIIYQNNQASLLTFKDKYGLGDVIQSFFFSPQTDSIITWGAGPVFYLPTESVVLFSAGQRPRVGRARHVDVAVPEVIKNS